jgi:hypothetical protein
MPYISPVRTVKMDWMQWQMAEAVRGAKGTVTGVVSLDRSINRVSPCGRFLQMINSDFYC